MLNKLICSDKLSLLKVLEVINDNMRGTVFIINDEQQLKGVVTDGDVRRMLLKGIQLDEAIGLHVNPDYSFAYENDDRQDIARKIDQRVKIIPIVNANHEITDFYEVGNKTFIPVASPSLKGNEFRYLTDALLSTWISSKGVYINRFENEFSSYCDTKYGISTSNGTVAIHLALKALDIGPGDEVIVPDFTFAATINAVLHAGATPVLVDIDPDTWCIDPACIEKAVGPATKAVIPVHIYGMPCKMDEIMDIAKRHQLYVIEDAAEAHGATFEGQKVGSFGDIATFSFFANKIITCGEGGMCLTNSSKLNERMRVLRDHGMSLKKRYWHDEVGFNYRMTNLQAAIGVAQLERIDEILQLRDDIRSTYETMFEGHPHVHFQKDAPYKSKRVIWLVSALLEDTDRDVFLKRYNDSGVELRPFFYPLSDMPIYKDYAKTELVQSKKITAKGISFPTYNEIMQKDFDIVKTLL